MDLIDSPKKALALDDEELRRINSQKLVKTVEDVGKCMVEASKTSKAMYRYIYLYMGLALGLVFLLIIGYVWSTGGVLEAYQSLFVPLDTDKVVICFDGSKNISFKKVDFDNLYYFKQSVNTSCVIKQ